MGRSPPGWKTYETPGRFTALLPVQGNFVQKAKTFNAPGLGIMSVKLARVELAGGISYTVGYVELPLKTFRDPQPGPVMLLFRDGFVKEVKGTVTQETDLNQGKVAGKDYVIQADQTVHRLRMFVVNRDVFRAEVSGTQAEVDSPEAMLFLDALKLPWHVTGLPP